MAQQVINVGASANDGTGDVARTAFQKANSNFDELYDAVDGVISGDPFVVATGTDAYVCNFDADPGATPPVGYRAKVGVANANTGAATLAHNGHGAIPIKKFVLQALLADDVRANGIMDLVFDGTNWQLWNPMAMASIGGPGPVELATDAEVITGTDAVRSVVPSGLAAWWTNVKTLVQTFAAKITFTSAPRFSSVNASEFLTVDGNKDLVSKTVSQMLTLLGLDGLVSSIAYTAYTPTWTGFTTPPTCVARYCLIGKLCHVRVTCTAAGTSNANTLTVTLPFAAEGTARQYGVGAGVDNGVNLTGASAIFTNTGGSSNVLDCRKDMAGAVWTVTGNKQISFNFTYEIA